MGDPPPPHSHYATPTLCRECTYIPGFVLKEYLSKMTKGTKPRDKGWTNTMEQIYLFYGQGLLAAIWGYPQFL
jgi:hypothetical protein